MNKSNTVEIPMKNFPQKGKLRSVNLVDWEFKLGKLTFKFPKITHDLKEYRYFLEHLAIIRPVGDIESEYEEDVSITYIDGYSSLGKMTDGDFSFKDFLGLRFVGSRGVLMEIGIEATGDTNMFKYVFNYYPKNLSSNSVDILEISTAVNEV